MRRFFLALRVRVQVVARSLAHVIQPMQRPAQRAFGHLLPGGDGPGRAEQGHRPVRGGEAEVLGRAVQEDLQQVLVVLVPERGAAPAGFVGPRAGIEPLGVDLDPVVHALARHTEHTCDVGGAAVVELQDGQGASEKAGIPRVRELAPQALSLPRGQVKPAHGLVLHHPCCEEGKVMSN